jgi:hypothetical protein
MKLEENKKINSDKISREAYAFNSFLDDYYMLIIMIAIFGIIISAFFFVLTPRYKTASETIVSARQALDGELGSLVKYSKALEQYEKDYGQIADEEKGRVNDIIGPMNKYSSIYTTDLLISYRDLFSSNGFELADIKVTENKVQSRNTKKIVAKSEDDELLPDGVSMMSIEVQIISLDYKRLRELLALLENRLRLADIQEINCDSVISDCSLKLDTYYFEYADK